MITWLKRFWYTLRFRWLMWKMRRNLRLFSKTLGLALLPAVLEMTASMEKLSAELENIEGLEE